MDPITVTICAGTACVVMDGSGLVLLEEHLPAHLKGRVKVRGERCLELCHGHGAAQGPYVLVAGEALDHASFQGIAARIEQLLGTGA